MKAAEFWKAVLVDRGNLLERFLACMRDSGIRFCVIGGTGVNAYAYPVVTQDRSDIARLLEAAPDLRGRVPAEILARIPHAPESSQ